MSAAASNSSKMMTSPGDMFTLENPVFCCYLFWSTVLVVKMLLMSLLTAVQRFRYKVGWRYEDKIISVHLLKGHHHSTIQFTAAGDRTVGTAAQGNNFKSPCHRDHIRLFRLTCFSLVLKMVIFRSYRSFPTRRICSSRILKCNSMIRMWSGSEGALLPLIY